MLRVEAKRRLLADPALFLLHYFPHRIGAFKDFHLDLIDSAARERRSLTLFPATHGKTSILSELLPIWAMCVDPDVRIAAIFKNEGDARAITRAVMAELTTNTALIRDYGPFRDEDDEAKTWTQTRFDIHHRTRKGKSSTWAAFGAGSRNALGYRTDWTILDDCVTDQNSSTPEQRLKLAHWFNQGPLTMPDTDKGRITVVGTAFHPEDLYHDLMGFKKPGTDDELWVTKVRRAILDNDRKMVLWPELRPYSFLMEQKETMGTLDFNKRFQNIALDPSGLMFHEDYVLGGRGYPGCVDNTYELGRVEPSWPVYIGFDPAIGVSRHRKFCAHITLAVGSCPRHERCLWVVDLKRGQMTLPQQVELILDRHAEYGATKTVVETNGYQQGLYQQIRQRMDERDLQYLIEPHYTTKVNKPDPHAGVSAMSALVEQGKLHIPWADAASRAVMQVLVDEMLTYPEGRTTDTVMAMWFAFRAQQQSAPRFKVFNRLEGGSQFRFPQRQPLGMMRVRNPHYDQSG